MMMAPHPDPALTAPPTGTPADLSVVDPSLVIVLAAVLLMVGIVRAVELFRGIAR